MFLRPHHFQATDQHWLYVSHTGGQWDHHFNWGLRSLDLDLEALGNNTVVIRSAQARTREGTLIEAREDDLQPWPLNEAFRRGPAVTVFLRVPMLKQEGGNIPTSLDNVVRFRTQRIDVEDENRRGNPQCIDVRRLNVSLFVHDEMAPADLTGYEYLPIARIERSARVNAVPQLVSQYIPPVLTCDSWRALAEDVLQAIYHRVGKKIEMLSTLFRGRRAPADGLTPGATRVTDQLRVLNEAYVLLHILAFVKGIHPLTAYLELCRLAGQLAVFGPERRPTDLPPHYDHDDLGKCFYKVKEQIDMLLEAIEAPRYELESFVVAGAQLHASIKPKWVKEQWPLYIGVASSLEPVGCVQLLCGRLDMKVGSKDQVGLAYTRGGDSLVLVPVPDPPAILPRDANLVYFGINRTPHTEPLWKGVLQSEKLAIQFNRTMRADEGEAVNLDGDSILHMKLGETVQWLEFTLYAVPPEGEPAALAGTWELRP
jgi:type VI secretion system protein ImpJ